jgi:hypothetical protein
MVLDPSGSLLSDSETSVDIDGEMEMESAGLRLYYDLPTGRDQALRLHYEIYALSTAGELEVSEASIRDLLLWQRVGLTYLWQLTGYSSDATFDCSMFLGAMGDTLLADDSGAGGEISGKTRISPYVGIEMGFWQRGPAGLLFRLGQTVPFNVHEVTASVTDAAAVFRVDFSPSLSLHIGYAWYWARFKSYVDSFSSRGEEEELTLRMQGPMIGLDLRF